MCSESFLQLSKVRRQISKPLHSLQNLEFAGLDARQILAGTGAGASGPRDLVRILGHLGACRTVFWASSDWPVWEPLVQGWLGLCLLQDGSLYWV